MPFTCVESHGEARTFQFVARWDHTRIPKKLLLLSWIFFIIKNSFIEPTLLEPERKRLTKLLNFINTWEMIVV